jgi:hypothetical protein
MEELETWKARKEIGKIKGISSPLQAPCRHDKNKGGDHPIYVAGLRLHFSAAADDWPVQQISRCSLRYY